jgi:hypothetical protein
MKKLVVLLIGVLLCFPVFAWDRGSGWMQGGDLDIGGNSIDGSATLGLRLDPDNDNTNEVTIATDGTVTAKGFVGDGSALTGVTADTSLTADDANVASGSTVTVAGGTGCDTSATGTTLTIAVDNTVLTTSTSWGGDLTGTGTGPTVTTNAVALATDTTGNYVATIAGTANEITVAGSGTENAAVTLSLPAVIDLGDDTSIEIPNSTDPDVDAEGEISWDTDDDTLRGYATPNQVVIGQKTKSIQFALQDPENIDTPDNRASPSTVVWYNDTGFTFNITKIRGMSDGDNYDFVLFESNGADDIGTANDSQIDIVECETDGTGGYYIEITAGFDDSTIANNSYLIWDHNDGVATNVQVYVGGYLDADVD